MNPSFQLIRPRAFTLALVAGVSAFSGCATAVRPVAVNQEHPANPHAASGTPAPVDFPLLAPAASNSESEAGPAHADEKPAVHHHHDS